MDPVTKTIQLIRENPQRANALADQWQAFTNTYARENPEILTINSKEGFYGWVTQHPEKNINLDIWIGKEVIDVYGEKTKVYQNMDDDPTVKRVKKEIDEQVKARQGQESISGEIQGQSWERFANEYPEKARVYATKDDDQKNDNVRRLIKDVIEREGKARIQTPTREFFNRGIGRGIGGIERGSARLGGRVAGRTGSMAGRLASRLAVQAGMAAGRAVVGALVSNPIGWVVIGVIVAIIIIVFLIIMLAGGGGIGGGFQATVECVDPNNPSKSVLVTDGNTCAQNAATFYSNVESIAVTTKCLDRCTDFLKNSCERNINNLCSSPDSVCGTPFEAFCIEYTPADAAKKRLYDCITGGSGYAGFPMYVNCGPPTPTPTPTL